MRATMLIAIILLSFSAHAEMYRWTDSSGQVHYSQTPPASGNATEIKAPPVPPQQPQAQIAAKQLRERQESDRLGKIVADAKKADTKLSQETKDKNCKAAKHNLTGYQSLGRKITKLPDGTYKRYDETERQKKIQQAQDQIKKFCP